MEDRAKKIQSEEKGRAVLNREVGAGLTKKTVFQQRVEGGEGVGCMDSGEKSVLAERIVSAKALWQARAWHVARTARRSMGLEWNKQEF